MPSGKQISNPGGLFGQTADTDTQIIAHFYNSTAAALSAGDIVAATAAGTIVGYTTMTTAQTATNIIGVVSYGDDGAVGVDSTTTRPSYAVSAVVPVVLRGVALINIGANTIAVGDPLTNSTVSGTVLKSTVATPAGTVVATALQTSTQVGSSGVLIAALIKSA